MELDVAMEPRGTGEIGGESAPVAAKRPCNCGCGEARNGVSARPKVETEVFTIPLEEGRFLLYAPLRQSAFVGNARTVNLLADLQAGCYDPAADPQGAMLEMLRRLEFVDSGPDKLPLTTFTGDPSPTTLTLYLTTVCNLRCTYCYASAGDTPLEVMSLETAKRGIDFVTGNAVRKGQKNFDVSFHGGGEPTANWSVMTAAYDYAKARAGALGLTLTAATASNGVLRDDQIDWIIQHLAGVSLSYDGLPEAHDRHRLTVSGKGSSERVIHTIRRFDAAGFPYGIRITVTLDQIPNLAEGIDYIFTHFKPARVQVEPSYQLGRWSEAASAETESFIAAYRDAQARASSYGREITYSAARVGSLVNHFCGISQDSFALSPGGNVSACYEVFSEASPMADVFFYGKPDTSTGGYRFNLPVLDNLRKQSVEHREFCRGCFAKWHCAGDCYHKSLSVNGRGEFAGSDRCHVTRELTKDQILARIKAAGGYFWHEPPTDASLTSARGKEILS